MLAWYLSISAVISTLAIAVKSVRIPFASGDAGTVLVEGDNITLDGQGGASGFTGIASNADSGSSGDGGLVSVTANGNLKILDGSEISSNTPELVMPARWWLRLKIS